MAEVIKVNAIVLKSNKAPQDAARRLELFSLELGKISALIRGVEKPKAKNAVASQPFCFGEYLLNVRNGNYFITECAVQDSFFALSYNLDAYVLACAMLEATSLVAVEGESNVEYFTLLLNCLKLMAYHKANPSAVFIKYIMNLLSKSGFGFDLSSCFLCGKQSFGVGKLVYDGSGAVCSACMHKVDYVDISDAEWGILKNIYNADIQKFANLNFSSREALNSCLMLMLKQFYYRTGEKIKCLDKYF